MRPLRTVHDASGFYADLGLSVIPVRPDKKPALSSWKRFTTTHANADQRRSWFVATANAPFPNNIAIVAGTISRVVCVDADSRDVAVELYRTLPKTSMMTKTPRGGVHFWYRTGADQQVPPRVKVGGKPIDIRGDGSYALAAPSVRSDDVAYEAVGEWNLSDAPYFDSDWLKPFDSTERSNDRRTERRAIRDLRAYLRKVESKQGENGSAGLMRACHLAREAGCSESETTLLLLEWNREVPDPPWSNKELSRAITRAFQAGQ